MNTIANAAPERTRPIRSLATVAALSLLLSAMAIRAAALTEVSGFGPNPTSLRMFLYVPDNLPDHSPVLVALHWCHGTAQNFYDYRTYKTLATTYKYMVIYPNANSPDSCFDVHSTGTLTHDGGGDALGIASMVRYVLKNKKGDSTRVYATGHSSGGMMCNVLAGSYPDLFKAISASAGVPFGCFGSGTNSWNDSCAKGLIIKTGTEWGAVVHAAYPGYTGPRPRMQLWHGENDNVLAYVNFNGEVGQWCSVLGAKQTPVTAESDVPVVKYTRKRYTDAAGNVLVEAISGAGQDHNITVPEMEVVKFFGLDQPVATFGRSPGSVAAASGAVLTVGTSSRGINVSVVAPPGRITIDLYQIDGSRIVRIADRFCADGRLATAWVPGATRFACPAIGVVSVSVDGRPVARHRFARTGAAVPSGN